MARNGSEGSSGALLGRLDGLDKMPDPTRRLDGGIDRDIVVAIMLSSLLETGSWSRLALTAVLATACSGSTAVELTEETFCSVYAARGCALYTECGCFGGDKGACEAEWLVDCEEYTRDATALGEVYNPAIAESCLAGLSASVSECLFVDPTAYPPQPYFCGVYRGVAKEGESCRDDVSVYGCAVPEVGEAFCWQSDGEAACRAEGTKRVGESCVSEGTSPPCEPGAACDANTATCVPLPGVGAPCDPNAYYPTCDNSSFCNATTRSCAKPAELGERCQLTFRNPTCVAGARCDPETEMCRPAPITESHHCGD